MSYKMLLNTQHDCILEFTIRTDLEAGNVSIQDIVTECPAIVHVLAQLPWNTGQQIQAIVQEVVGQILRERGGRGRGRGGGGEGKELRNCRQY